MAPFASIRERLLAGADRNVGLLAEFAHPGDLVRATEEVRRAGYSRIDTFTPFPIHGMDRAMGLGPSRLGYLVMGGGLAGLALALLMQWWMGDANYPINIGGKPLFAIEPSVPVAFEVTVLLAALTAVAGMLALNGLPQPYNPLFHSERFNRVTDDAFFLQISASDRNFDEAEASRLLRELGALHVEFVDHEGAREVGEDGAAIREA